MKVSIRLLLLSLVLLALVVAGCGGGKSSITTANTGAGSSGSGSSSTATHLIAKAEMAGGKSVELRGDFLSDTTTMRQRLKADLEDAALAAGTSISFCLVHGTAASAPLGVGMTGKDDETEMDDADEAQLELDSQNKQTVPAVAAGDVLEARSGAKMDGTADCTATLLISATFQTAPAEIEETELRAETETEDSMMAEVKLRSDFQSETGRTRLRGRFEDSALASGSSVSFCLVSGKNNTALAVAKIGSGMDMSDNEAEAAFVLDSTKGQTVPAVAAGDSIEAHQGANTDGTAVCSAATLLASATFQAEDNEKEK
jgi:hypothetical protein